MNDSTAGRTAAQTAARSGVAMGAGAIVLWSTSAAVTAWTGTRIGPWQFLAMGCLLSSALQIALNLALGRPLRRILLPPPRLWLIIVTGIAVCLCSFAVGLATAANRAQAIGVTLANYMWPSLTVVFSVLLVPGTRASARLAVAVALSVAGVLLAGSQALMAPGARTSLLPYAFGLAAGVSWAWYSAMMARWRDWARNYATAPLGMLTASLVGAAVCTARGLWHPVDAASLLGLALAAMGPQAGGYLLWELALHRASPATLGLMGAATPVLSTVWLLVMYATVPGVTTPGTTHPGAVLGAAALIGVSVFLGTWKRRG